MKITLIFSPFIDPSYIPLGIAQLKSYVESQLPFVKVCNLDLNIHFFNNLTKKGFLNLCKNLCYVCPKKNEHLKNMENIFNYGKLYTVSVNCLRDKETREFYDTVKYNYLIKNTSFFNLWRDCFATVTKGIIENERKIPQLLENLLQGDINMILNERPNIVGFSIFSEEQLAYSLTIAKMLKDEVNLPIIFGGAFMSYIDIPTFLDIFDFIDFVIGKEGEIGLTKFIRYFKNKNFKNVPGLFYRQKNEILHNNEEFIQNLDNIPFPDFSDFDLGQYLFPIPVLPTIFSRGCFWRKCTFCTYNRHYPVPYKIKTVGRFIEEIKFFKAMGIKYFMIDDDVISTTHLNLISSLFLKENLKIFFGAIIRPDKSFSFEKLKNIYRAGGRLLIWGVESSCQRLLDLMNKGTKVKDIESILKNAYEVGFHNCLFMISGFPTQTEEEIYNDMKFLQKNRRHIRSFFVHRFNLTMDSYIYNNPEKFGIKNFKETAIYSRRKKSLYSNVFSFEHKTKLNWKRISEREDGIFKPTRKLFANSFQSCSHAHMLIHASVNGEVAFKHREIEG